MKTFFITGATGFVGKYLIDLLAKSYPDSKIIATTRSGMTHTPPLSNVHFEVIDLSQNPIILYTLDRYRPDYIIHLASYSSVGFSWNEPILSFNNNVNIFLNLLEAVRHLNLKSRILSIGSSEQYGRVSKEDVPLVEDFKLNPISPYGVARVSQELLSKVYAEGYGLDIIMTRSFNHFGPGQDNRFFIPSIINKVLNSKNEQQNKPIETGDLSIIRDFVDVRDVVEAYKVLLEKGKSGEVYNICSGIGYTLLDIFNMICDLIDVEPNSVINPQLVRPNDNPVIIGDNRKLINETGWTPSFDVKTSLTDTINFIKSMRHENII